MIENDRFHPNFDSKQFSKANILLPQQNEIHVPAFVENLITQLMMQGHTEQDAEYLFQSFITDFVNAKQTKEKAGGVLYDIDEPIEKFKVEYKKPLDDAY